MEWLKRNGSGIGMKIGWNGSGMVEVELNGMEVEQEVIWKGKWNGGGMEWNGFCINKL